MTSKMNRSRIIVILLFAITFTLIGWVSPVLYASYVPQGEIIESHEFIAQDTSTTADQHYICFDRTVQQASAADTFTELYMLDSDGNRIEVTSNSDKQYFQQGRTSVITPLDLPDDLAEGEYKYMLVAQFDLANGRVERTFAFESETFVVNDSINPIGAQQDAINSCQ